MRRTYTEGTFLPGEGAILRVQVAVNQEFEDYLRDTGQVVPAPESVSALIDPGADCTFVNSDVIAKFALPVIGKTQITGITGMSSFQSTYDVRFLFPHGSSHTVTIAEIAYSFRSITGHLIECLIGCDLLARGRFIYDGPKGRFRLTI